MSEALVMEHGQPAVREQPAVHLPEPIPHNLVAEQLARILASRTFARSPRISRFLEFVVEQTLLGEEDKLKEYLLGVEVFNRLDSFDPRIDSIVRVEARRLRYKLEKYYETEGVSDEIYIQFRKGCYIPIFSNKRVTQAAVDVFQFPHLSLIENPHAFALFAKGRHYLGRWSAEGIVESISCFSQAVAEDPTCAEAHAGLSAAWALAAMLGVMPARDVMPKAKASARDAIAANPECAEGHAVQGITAALHDFEWNQGEAQLRKAIQLNQCSTGSRLWYGLGAMLAGRSSDAIRELKRAQHSDPTCITAHLGLGFAYQLTRAYDDALMQYRLAQELSPSCYAPHLATGLLFTEQRMHEQAHQSLSHASQLSPRNPHVMAALVYSHACAGRTDAARQVIQEMKEISAKQYVPPIALCMANSAMGDIEEAMEELEEAYEERSCWLALVRSMPAFSSIRDDSRYPALLARVGLA